MAGKRQTTAGCKDLTWPENYRRWKQVPALLSWVVDGYEPGELLRIGAIAEELREDAPEGIQAELWSPQSISFMLCRNGAVEVGKIKSAWKQHKLTLKPRREIIAFCAGRANHYLGRRGTEARKDRQRARQWLLTGAALCQEIGPATAYTGKLWQLADLLEQAAETGITPPGFTDAIHIDGRYKRKC